MIHFWNITLGASDSFTTGTPASLAAQPVPGPANSDVDFPNDITFDDVGDLMVANGGSGNPDFGNFACVPAGAVTTGSSNVTVLSNQANGMDDPDKVVFGSDRSVALINQGGGTPLLEAQFVLSPTYTPAPVNRDIANPNSNPPTGAVGVVPLPASAANPAGSYVVTLVSGSPITSSGTHLRILHPDGSTIDFPQDTSVVDPYTTYDPANNQLVAADSNGTHSRITFWTVSTTPGTAGTKVKDFVMEDDGAGNSQVKALGPIASSADGHIAVIDTGQSGYPELVVYDNTANRNKVSGALDYGATTTAGGATWVYGGNNAVNVATNVIWLSNTKLLVLLNSENGHTPTSANGMYIYDITQTMTQSGFDVNGNAEPTTIKQTGFQALSNNPLAAAIRTGTANFADGTGNNCSGNSPCFTSINSAIAALTNGGTVNVLGGTFNESVNVNNASVTVNINATTTINDFTISAGTLTGGGGNCGQATTFTLNLKGNWANNGGTFAAGGGTVVFNGTSGAQTIGGAVQTTFNNLTINNSSGVNLSNSETTGGTLTLTSGALGVGTNTLTLNGAVAFTSGTITSSASGLVNYNQGSNAQNVAPGNYGNLTFSNFTKTLPNGGAVKIAGTFTTGATGGHTVTGSTVEFNGASAQTLPANFATYNGLTINNANGVTLGGNITVNGLLTLTSGNVTTNANTLSIGSSGTRSRTSGYILGNEKKTYAGNISFTFDVGTANGYSPVDTTTTAGTGDLTVLAVQGAEPSVVSSRSLQRYWTLTGGGAGVTANLVFHYLDPTDIAGSEGNYQVIQVTSGARNYFVNNCPNTCVNAAANTLALTGVTSFSDFTAGEARADLQVTSLTASPSPVVAGNNITYTVNLINNGPDSSEVVTVTDPLPASTTFVSVSLPAGWSRTDSVAVGGTGTIVVAKGTVANGETAALQVVVNVNGNTVGGSTISNTATAASAVTTDPVPGNESGTASTLVDTPPTFTDGPPPTTATAGTAYSFTYTASGFPTPITYGVTAGALPDGLSLSTAGTISGTPTKSGLFTGTVTATNTTGTANQNFSITVSPGPATQFSVSAPATANAGAAFNVTLTAQDQYGNTATGYTGTVHFTSTDGSAALPANSTLTNGTGTFSVTLRTAGNQTITGTDTVTASITGASNTIAVSAVAATHLAVSAPASATAGSAFNFTVTALDQFNNTATGYGGTVHFTSTDGAASLPANTTLTSGTGTFSATLKTAGNQTITGTDTVTASITGTSGTVTVNSAAATHFSVVAPASATAGTAFNLTVTALDQFNNTATGYAGTVHFTSTDGSATLPANSTLTNGTGTFSATLKVAGNQTITATDTVTSSITGTTNAISVSAGASTHFAVSAPASATAGSAFNFTVTALDQFNNTTTGYAGTVHFTSTDAAATLPANSTLTNGVGTFSATLKTSGNQTITSADTVTASITGTSNAITVSAAAATHFGVSAPATATINTAFNFTVTALDQFNNTVTGYAGTVHFTSTDGTATLPANSTLTSGAGTFSATLKTAGNQTITATDTINASVTGASGTINVSKISTTTGVTSSANPSNPGQNVTFTATVAVVPPGTGTPTGTVQFLIDGTNFGTAVALTGNTAQTSTSSLSVGNHPVTAQYNGTATFNTSSGTLSGGQTVSAPTPTPTPSPTATATATPTATPTATATASPTPTATPSPTASPTASPTPTATPSPTASPTASPTPTATPSATATPTPTPAQALNISTRLRVDIGDKVMIGGFIITGNANKPVVLRGLGPSLVNSGVPAGTILLDPVLELHGSNGSLIMKNDNWKDDQRPLIEGTIYQPTDDRESVIVATLPPGAYTAILTGKGQTTGVGLVEVYDNNQAADSALANISTRGFVQAGDNVMIGGFTLGNNPTSTHVGVRGIGPSLASSGLSNLLADPTIALHNANGTIMISNDNWTDDPVSAAQLTANGLALQDPKESGIFTLLPPGPFTAILAGKNGGTGIGLIEIYNLK